MKKWWQETILWLMLGTSMLVITLSVLWLRSAYQDARDNLSRETSYLFADAVRSLEDSLIQHSFLSDLDHAGHSKTRFGDGIIDSLIVDGSVVGVIKRRLEKQPKSEENKRRRWHRRALGLGGRGFAGMLSLHLQPKDTANVEHLYTEKVDPTRSFSMLESTVLPVFHKQDYPFTYQLVMEDVPLSSQADSVIQQAHEGKFSLTTRTYFDLSAGKKYYMAFENVNGYLIGKIRLQIVFTLLLIALTAFTFYLSFRTMIKERKLMSLRSDLVSNITHELKTPIATVKVALEAIQNFGADTDPTRRKEYLQIAETELDRLALLVDSVLKTSVQEGKEVSLEMQRIDLHELVKEILTTMHLQFDKLKATVRLKSSEKPMWVNGDKIHLTSVIYNLLDNAIKYSSGPPQINLQLDESEAHYRLSVSDAGIGMEQDELSKIFDKFYRTPQANVHDTKGYGLGLSYVAEVMKKHAGSIQVRSNKGLGSTFTIAMPQATGP